MVLYHQVQTCLSVGVNKTKATQLRPDFQNNLEVAPLIRCNLEQDYSNIRYSPRTGPGGYWRLNTLCKDEKTLDKS